MRTVSMTLRQWLRSPEADDFLDAAVQGWLTDSWAEEVAQDFGYDLERSKDRREFSRAIGEALREGY